MVSFFAIDEWYNIPMYHYQEYHLAAYYIAKEINLGKTAEKLDKNLTGKRREFLTYLLGPKQYLFVFSFGAVVFVNVAKDMQTTTRKLIMKYAEGHVKKDYNETYLLHESDGKFAVTNDDAMLPMIGMDEIEIAARVIAQSVALEHIEDLAEEILNNIGSMNTGLEKAGRFSRNAQTILRSSAQNNNIIQFVISKISLLDKPDITWNRAQLENLFSQLADLFELRSRFRNIEYKIKFARDNSEFAFHVLHGERANFLELIVIILIIFEILLYAVELWR
jgi:uncharacterized Rmd1/YagE family protein